MLPTTGALQHRTQRRAIRDAERGLGLVYAAFILMVTALLVRFGRPRREIRAGVTEARGWLEGRSEYYPTLFQEEIDRLLTKQ